MFVRWWKLLPVIVTVIIILSSISIVRLMQRYADGHATLKLAAYRSPVVLSGNTRILVTGAAGFIGFHLSRTLAEDVSNTVVVMDNFNDYYDVRLKIDRAYELSKLNIKVYNDDVCNEDFLSEIFERYNFTHVAHLAAQAGVRYSLDNPQAYIRANVQCQVVLLDTLKRYPHIHTVYASSSSVYGKEASVPFRLDALTDRPGNMYAATKRTDELLGLQYCREHGLSMVGLRFFTVYGPWGRPDMAVYTFAEAMVQGKDVPLFTVDDPNKVLGRDFTYVDDIVSGIVATLNYAPATCGERFNLGFGHPVSVPDMLNIMEYELSTAASVKLLPLPPSEILQTWADISASTYYLNFQPKTNLTIGVRAFIKWYKDYNEKRKTETSASAAQIWFDKLVVEKESRKQQYEQNHIDLENTQLRARVEGIAAKYKEWAQQNGIQVPQLNKTTFHFYPGVAATGKELKKVKSLANQTEALKAKCRQFDQCIAFHVDGSLLKSIHKPPGKPSSAAGQQGLYVADIDMCKADLHNCKENEACHHEEPGIFSCYCPHAFKQLSSKKCVPRYGSPVPRSLQWQYDAIPFSVFNVSAMKQAATQMVYIKDHVSSSSTYLVAEQYKGNQSMLEKICRDDQLCTGITSEGHMQSAIKPYDEWQIKEGAGMLVYDFDYCQVSPSKCKYHQCQRASEGKYRCIEPPKAQKATPTPKATEKTMPPVNMVYTLDEKSLQAVVASINSVLRSTASIAVTVHLIVCGELSETEIRSYLECYNFEHHNFRFNIVEFDMSLLDETYMKYQETTGSTHNYLQSCGNYARFFIPRLLPSVEIAVYMDVDICVRKDVSQFVKEANQLNKYPVAFLDRSINYHTFIRKKDQALFSSIFFERYQTEFDYKVHAFNAGFFIANLSMMRRDEEKINVDYHFWMNINIKHKFWYTGTQSLMLLTFYRNVQAIFKSALFLDGLGYRKVSVDQLLRGVFLHWNGQRKPWLEGGAYISTWRKFLPQECVHDGKQTGECKKQADNAKLWQCAV